MARISIAKWVEKSILFSHEFFLHSLVSQWDGEISPNPITKGEKAPGREVGTKKNLHDNVVRE